MLNPEFFGIGFMMAEKNVYKLTAKILIGFLGLWALIIPILYIFGTTIYFPFKISGGGEIPYYRLQAVRLAVCLTFSYFAFRFLFIEYSKLYPIQFLDVFLKSLALTSLLVYFSSGVEIREYTLVFFFFACSIITHIISGKKFRKYFN